MNMAFDVKMIAEINLAVQILLTLILIGAVYMVKNSSAGTAKLDLPKDK
jgi:hypothetical protein